MLEITRCICFNITNISTIKSTHSNIKSCPQIIFETYFSNIGVQVRLTVSMTAICPAPYSCLLPSDCNSSHQETHIFHLRLSSGTIFRHQNSYKDQSDRGLGKKSFISCISVIAMKTFALTCWECVTKILQLSQHCSSDRYNYLCTTWVGNILTSKDKMFPNFQ